MKMDNTAIREKKILEQKDTKGCKRHSMLSSQLPQLCGGRRERKAKTFIVLCSCALALLHRGKWNWNLDNEFLLNALHWALSNSTFQGKTWWQQWPAKALTVASPQAGQKIWDREEWLTARQSSSCTWPHTLEGYESRLTSSPSLRHQFPSSKSPFKMCNASRVARPVDNFGNWERPVNILWFLCPSFHQSMPNPTW